MKNSLIKYKDRRVAFDTLVKNIWNDMWIDPFFGLSRGFRPEFQKETDKDKTFEVELPRVKRSDVKVVATNENTIQIEAKNDRVLYTRLFTSDDIDAEKAVVKLEDGVLTVTCPKIAITEPKAKVLEIN